MGGGDVRTDEVVERCVLREQVGSVELVAGTERPQAARVAVELAPDAERTELLHPALLRTTILKPHLQPPQRRTVYGSTQPCIPPGSLNRPAAAGVGAGMSTLPGDR